MQVSRTAGWVEERVAVWGLQSCSLSDSNFQFTYVPHSVVTAATALELSMVRGTLLPTTRSRQANFHVNSGPAEILDGSIRPFALLQRRKDKLYFWFQQKRKVKMPSHNRIAGNKLRRQALHVQEKRTSGKERREERMRRRKQEAKEPELKAERLARNQTKTIEQKRIWDDGDEDSLYTSADVAAVKRRKLEEAEQAAAEGIDEDDDPEDDEDVDSMLGSDDEDEEGDEDDEAANKRMEKMRAKRAERQPSAAPSTTSTNFDMTPAVLSTKFPNLFNDEPPKRPKVLITTSINSTLHKEAGILMSLFPNSEYIPRSAHRFGYKYSVREICRFANNRDYTVVLVLNEDQKKPNRLTVVHLPHGPTLTYSVNNWLPGSKLPGHGNAQDEFYPELLLNNFKSSLGLLSAKSFQTL